VIVFQKACFFQDLPVMMFTVFKTLSTRKARKADKLVDEPLEAALMIMVTYL